MVERPPEIEAAFTELGLAPGLHADDLRRGYLRVIKLRQPEVDPAGCLRAREAFELLTDWFGYLARTGAPPPPRALPPEGWDTLEPLLAAGHVAQARARISELLAANVAPPEVQSLLFVVLDLHRQHPGPGARATLEAFLAWVERAQAELTFAAQPARWLLIRELAKLPARTPHEVEALLVAGILDGTLDRTMQGLEAFTRARPADAEALLLSLGGASPLLHQLLMPVLNLELL